jgi:DNA repair exonuclease SbcCD ATPase subunit
MHSWQIRSINLLAVLVLAGCVAPVSTNIKPSPAEVAKYSDLPDLKVVATLEKEVNEAKNANMPFLAPSYFREASQILSDSQSALGNKPRDVLVNNAAKGDAILEKGRAVMAIVQYRFAKELDYKAQLEEYNAPSLLPRDYEKVIGDFSGLIEKVEREQPENIDNAKEALLKSMLDLVIRSVQEGALRESALINADSKMKNADRQAPITYMEAIRVYQDAKNRIAAAYRDKELVQRLGAQATFAARHAQQVNDRVALLQVRLKISPPADVLITPASGNGTPAGTQPDGKPAVAERYTLEKIVLQEEDRLLAISNALGMKDMRDQPLDKQVEAIRHAIIEAANQPNGEATAQDYEARLAAANRGIQQNVAELAQKDKQLAEKDKQLTEKDKQLTAKDHQLTEKEKLLAEKNAQIKTLKNKLQSMKLL